VLRAAGLLTAAGTLACAAAGAGRPGVPAPGVRRDSVHVWVTTPDQHKLLAREPSVAFTADSPAALPVIDVDDRTTYQRMIGFGAAFTDASVYLVNRRMSPAQREELLEDLFGRTHGIGLSFARVPMGASDFSLRHYSYDDMPPGETDPSLAHFSIDADRADKLPVIRRALAINPDLTIMASPWSAPGWMKTSGSLIGGSLRPEFHGAFADYFVRFVQAYRAEGIPVHAVSIQNEPHFEPADYPGMRVEPATRARVIGEFLGPRLTRAGLGTQIWEWDHNWDEPASPLAVLADSAARRYVQGVAWHCYGGDVSAQSVVHDAHPAVDTYFSECSGGRWATRFADNLAWYVGTLVIGATRNWARAVALWNLALDEADGPHLGGCGDCRGVVTVVSTSGAYIRNVEYYALGHASRFVRPGAVRVASSSGVEGLASVAFRNADDGSLVAIVLNGGAESRTFALRWNGRWTRYTLPAGAVATFRW
jgi:glucosylceramidase